MIVATKQIVTLLLAVSAMSDNSGEECEHRHKSERLFLAASVKSDDNSKEHDCR